METFRFAFDFCVTQNMTLDPEKKKMSPDPDPNLNITDPSHCFTCVNTLSGNVLNLTFLIVIL